MSDDVRRTVSQYRLEQFDRALESRTAGEGVPVAANDASAEPEPESEVSAPTAADRAAYVETAIQQAIRRGEFDNLPGAGKPLPGLNGRHDPDWWIRRKIESEQLTGLGPPALTLRTEDAALDDRLDRMHREEDVRAAIDDFNARVKEARRQLLGGPPVVTGLRDPDRAVRAWRERRLERARRAAAEQERQRAEEAALGWRERRRRRRASRS
ncbi:DnaJ family domain-containing protein [Agromyces sp. ZXT2-6]|uniref:DnaJ family domain-containing protein n=1 Tax=Agromyces sp. ZXT2-6 TaxID=3461153 RepID=UPI004054FCD0